MKAAIQHRFGPPHVLATSDALRPRIGAHEMLVEVHASPVTQGDRRLRAADFPGISWLAGRLMFGLLRPKHRTPGTAFAGRVVEVGAGVTRFSVGDDVFGSCMHGAQAEYLAVPEDSPVARSPRGMNYDEAAALPYGALTSVVFLRDLAAVEPGHKVLVIGAAGGVGRMAVQVAHDLGAEVTAVDSRSHDLLRSLGANHVIDHTARDFTEESERYDAILDTTAPGVGFRRCRRALTARGRYLSLHMSFGLIVQMIFTKLVGGRRAIAGVAMGDAQLMDTVRGLAEAGAVRPVISDRYPLSGLSAAHARLESGPTPGTIMIQVAA